MKIINDKLISVDAQDLLEGEIIIPKNVTAISREAFKDFKEIKKITIPGNVKIVEEFAFSGCDVEEVVIEEGLKEIRQGAFKKCKNLRKASLPSTIKNIGEEAFCQCRNLTEANLPEGLKTIEKDLFRNCENLKDINIPSSVVTIGYGAFFNCCKIENVELENVVVIDNTAFQMCERLTRVKLSDTIQHIGAGVFSYCFKLQEINLPSSIKTIESDCFARCSSLKEVILPPSLFYVASGLFNSCHHLEHVVLPKITKAIGSSVFQNCFSLKSIELPEGLIEINSGAFENTSLVEVVLPDSVNVIGADAFKDCGKLEKFVMSKNLKQISRRAFQSCKSLKDVIFKEGLLDIKEEAFENCESLEQISFPTSLLHIEDKAFKCSALERLVLHKNTVIGKEAFCDCKKLQSVIFPEDLKEISESSFKNCELLTEIVLPKELKTISAAAFNNCSRLKRVEFNDKLESIGATAFKLTAIEELFLPNSVKEISFNAFGANNNLKKVKLPDYLEEISNMCFYGNGELIEVKFPKELKMIEVSAFEFCEKLESVILPDSLKKINSRVFANCSNLKNVNLPSGIEMIGGQVFLSDKKLETLELYNATVLNDAFENCSNLKYLIMSSQNRCKVPYLKNSLMFLTRMGEKFCFSREKLGEDSLELPATDISCGLLTTCYHDKNNLFRETTDKKILGLYNVLFENLTLEQFNDFYKNKNLKFFKQIFVSGYETLNFENYCKLYYNLGGFMQPREEFHISKSNREIKQVVDYAQKVGEYFKEHIEVGRHSTDSVFSYINFYSYFSKMQWTGFKREFTNFFLDKNNLIPLSQELQINPEFLSQCYNTFENAQKHNTSNKGSQRQLVPTVKSLRRYLFLVKFKGTNQDNSSIAEIVGEYFSEQKTFDNALTIQQERIQNGTADHIIGEELTEGDVFDSIDEYSKSIESSAVDTLNILTQLAGKQFTFEWLAKSDPRNYILGKLCSCCSHLEGIGYGIMRASIIHPDIQSLVIKNKKGEIVAKSTLYINREEGYGVFNNVEVAEEVSPDKKEHIYLAYKRGLKAFAEKYNKLNPDKPIHVLTVGMERNDLEEIIVSHCKKSTLYKSINFNDYTIEPYNHAGDSFKEQRIVWKKEEENGI